MEKKQLILIISIPVFIILLIGGIILGKNETFFKTTYTISEDKEIYIPRFSYFDSSESKESAVFYTLESKKTLDSKIEEYLKDFTYISSIDATGYKKDNLFIKSYEVEDLILYRKIKIAY